MSMKKIYSTSLGSTYKLTVYRKSDEAMQFSSNRE